MQRAGVDCSHADIAVIRVDAGAVDCAGWRSGGTGARIGSALLEPDWIADVQLDEAEPTSGDRALLMEALSVTPTAVDTIIAATGLGVSTIQTLLLELDLAGRIEWSSGQLVALKS